VADGGAAVPTPPHRLDGVYPRVAYMLGAYLFGDDELEFEIDELVATEGSQQARRVLDELRKLLADPTVDDEELTAYVGTASPWMIQTGRITLDHVADQLAESLD
jgi:hypothetical protein